MQIAKKMRCKEPRRAHQAAQWAIQGGGGEGGVHIYCNIAERISAGAGLMAGIPWRCMIPVHKTIRRGTFFDLHATNQKKSSLS